MTKIGRRIKIKSTNSHICIPCLAQRWLRCANFRKGKQEGIISSKKIKILNRILTDIREVLSGEETVAYLDLLDEEKLPQNSDAVLVLGQYLAALDRFRDAHYIYALHEHTWVTKEWIEDRWDPEIDEDEEEEEVLRGP